MSQLADVQKFIDLSRQVSGAGDLDVLMQSISSEMGFDHFALIHHVDLTPFSQSLHHMAGGDLIALSNYPESWIEQYIADDIVSNDPVLLASQRTNVGFRWDEISKLVQVTSAHKEITERTRRAGIMNGFTVPAHVPGEANGSCNFAIGPHKELPAENLAMAQLVGSFAFQAARSLVIATQAPVVNAVRLTDHQLECVALVARGKSDWEIGRILGITEETVKRHIKDARERYDVPKRVQVVVRAAFDGQLPLSDIVK